MNKDSNGKFITVKEDDIRKRIEVKYSKFEYIGGYSNADGYIYLMCKDCGCIFKYSAQITRPSRYKKIVCSNCDSIIKTTKENQTRLERERVKSEQELERQAKKIKELKDKEIKKVCIECGEQFVTTKKNVKYCSKECTKKRVNNCKDRRLRKCDKVDYSITLKKLVKRDKGICHICGKKVNMNAEPNSNWYGSIDHVMAINQGGNHTWDNVKLAHRHCNTIKRDNKIYEKENGQLVIAI